MMGLSKPGVRWRVLAPVTALAAASLAVPSSAIVATPAPRVCAAFSSADAVVVGHLSDEGVGWEWTSWALRVERRYKGSVPARVRIYTPNDSGRGTPDDGRRNILFLTRENGRLTIGGSDPNGGGASVEAEVRALAAKPRRGPGTIALLVANEQGDAMRGVRVRLRHAGGERERTVRTDTAGKALLRAAPGRWTAEVADPGWTSRFSLYTYQRADGFDLAPGGCADLRLEPIRLGSDRKT